MTTLTQHVDLNTNTFIINMLMLPNNSNNAKITSLQRIWCYETQILQELCVCANTSGFAGS